jgi:uncharacterized membrane protein YeiH
MMMAARMLSTAHKPLIAPTYQPCRVGARRFWGCSPDASCGANLRANIRAVRPSRFVPRSPALRSGGSVVLRATAVETRRRGFVNVATFKSSLQEAEGIVPRVLVALDYIGTVAFAAAGTLVAGEAGMDTLGCTIVGTITALGGGTVRDMLLGRLPVFWFTSTSYVVLSIGVCLLTFYADDVLTKYGFLHDRVLFWGDTLGLGAFCVVGAQVATAAGRGPVIAVICGMLTATCGGLVRDVLCNRKAGILYSPQTDEPVEKGTLYASAALLGAGVFVAVTRAGVMVGGRPQAWSALAVACGACAAMSLRVYSQVYVVRLHPMKRFVESVQPGLDPGDVRLLCVSTV